MYFGGSWSEDEVLLCDGVITLGAVPGSLSPLRCMLGLLSPAVPYPLLLLLLCMFFSYPTPYNYCTEAAFWPPKPFDRGLRWRKEGLLQHPNLEPFQKVMGITFYWALKMLFGWVIMKIFLNTDFQVGSRSNSGCWLLDILAISAKITAKFLILSSFLMHDGHIPQCMKPSLWRVLVSLANIA